VRPAAGTAVVAVQGLEDLGLEDLGLEDLGLDASCLASAREQVETERRLKEARRSCALRNRIGRRYARPALEKIKSESIDRVSYPGGLEAVEDQPHRH
jgi:hypothetical protein